MSNINTHPKGYAERMLLFHAAAQGVLRDNPGHVLPTTCTKDDYIELVASFLAEGNCGMAVFWGGREMARHLLPLIEQMEQYETCLALHAAIECSTSLLDGEGDIGRQFKTSTCLDWLAGKPEAGEAGAQIEPLPSVERICRVIEQTYATHKQSIPAVLFEPMFAGLGLGSREAPTFQPLAFQLHQGLAGGVVFELGREFCQHILTGLEAIGAYALCPVLRRAVEQGESNWDAIGQLPPDSLETNLPKYMARIPT